MLQENQQLGQNVATFQISWQAANGCVYSLGASCLVCRFESRARYRVLSALPLRSWFPAVVGSSIGNKRIDAFAAGPVSAVALMLNVTGTFAAPSVSNFAAFAPGPCAIPQTKVCVGSLHQQRLTASGSAMPTVRAASPPHRSSSSTARGAIALPQTRPTFLVRGSGNDLMQRCRGSGTPHTLALQALVELATRAPYSLPRATTPRHSGMMTRASSRPSCTELTRRCVCLFSCVDGTIERDGALPFC